MTKKFLLAGHKVGLIIRSEKIKQEAIAHFQPDANIEYFIADLSDRSAVTQVPNEIKIKWDVVVGLFNNAGVLTSEEKQSPQGVELQFEVNAITTYNLSINLLEALKKSDNPFIVSTATRQLNKESELNIKELKRPKKFVKLTGSY